MVNRGLFRLCIVFMTKTEALDFLDKLELSVCLKFIKCDSLERKINGISL